MTGETNLSTLLTGMAPILREGRYVFCSVANAAYGDYAEAKPIASYVESEGLTLVMLKADAQTAGLSFDGEFACISLQINSSLEAVGLTAAVASALAAEDISANVMAAFYHDHIFVPATKANDALAVLQAVSSAN